MSDGTTAGALERLADSMRGVVLRVVVTCLSPVWSLPTHAQTFVAPGDTGSIEYPLKNSSISDATLDAAELQYDAPAHFIVKSASIRGPHSIPPAETYSFIVEYEIRADAPEGSFNVTLKPRSPSTSDETVTVAPDLTTLDTQVTYFADRTPPTMEFLDPGAVALSYGWATESLSADVRLMDAGSGVAGFDVYVGDPDKGGTSIYGATDIMGPDVLVSASANRDLLMFMAALPEGEFYLVAADQAGNKAKQRLAVDRTPPVVTLMDGEFASGFDGSAVGPAHVGDQTGAAGMWVHRSAQGFRMQDVGGVIALKVFRDTGVEDYSQPVSTITESFIGMVGMLPDRKDYVAAFWDVLGHVTMFKFSQDKTWPHVDLTRVKISEQDGTYFYAIAGTASDGLSGVSTVTLPARDNVAPVSLPGTLSASFSLPAVTVRGGMQEIALYDVAGNLGRGAVVSGGTTTFNADLSFLLDDPNTSVNRDVVFAGGSKLASVSASITNYDILPPSPVRCETPPSDMGKVQVYANSDYNDWPVGTAPEAIIEPIVPQTAENLVLDFAGIGSQAASLNDYVGQMLTLRAVRSPGASGCRATDASTIEAGRIYPVATIHAGGEGLVMTAVDEVIAQHVDAYSNVFMSFPKEGVTLSLAYVSRSGEMSVIVIPGQFSPSGYTNLAPGSAWDITTTAEYTGPVTITAKYDPTRLGLDAAAQNRIHMFHHLDGGSYEDVPVQIDTANRTVTGQVSRLSLFTLGVANEDVRHPDTTPPETALSYSGPQVPDLSGDPIISKFKTSLVLTRDDPVIPGYETSGVSATFVLVDRVPSDCGFAWGADPPVDMGAEAGTCENPVYNGPLFLPAGEHQIRYGSKDAAGNMEQLKAARVLVDDLTPETSPFFEGSTAPYSGGGTALSAQTKTGLLAQDPSPAGFAAGAATTYFLINSSREDCGFLFNQEPPIDIGQPAGTCQNPLYSAPFSLTEGTFTLTYFAADRVGNLEFFKSTTAAVDGTPPRTRLESQGPYIRDLKGLLIVSTNTSMTLSASDPSSNGVSAGVAKSMYFIDTAPVPGVPATVYAGQPFFLQEGTHTVYFRSRDWVNNTEVWRSTVVSSDGTPPFTTLSVQGSSRTGTGGEMVLSPDAYIVLTATDPLSNGVNSGLATTYYLIDATPESCAWGNPPAFDGNAAPGSCANPVYSGPFHVPPGRHSLGYLSTDKVDNAEAGKGATVVVDVAGPQFSQFQTRPAGLGSYSAEGSVIVGEKADARITVVDADVGLKVSGPGAAPAIPSGLVAWWRFEGDFKDSSPNGNDLTAQGAAQTSTSNKRYGSAAYYNNGTSGARGYRDSLIGWPGGNRDISLSAWVYHTANPDGLARGIAAVGITSQQGHFYIRGFTPPQWPFQTCTCARTFAVAADNGSQDNWVCGITPTELNRWSHVVATYSSATYTVRLYVNGRLEQEQKLSAPLNLGTAVQIGGDLYNDSWLYGYVDDVAVFGRAISGAEVAALYQLADTGKPYSARLSTDGGQTYLAVPAGDLAMSGSDGSTAAQSLAASNVAMVQSVGFNAPVNQLALTATDLSGNVTVSTFPVLMNLNPALAPLLAEPAAGLLVRSAALAWKFDYRIPVTAITNVEILTSRNAAFTDNLPPIVVGSTLNAVVGLADGVWYWKVRAKDGFGGYSPYSSTSSFTLDAAPPQFESPQVAMAGGAFGDAPRFVNSTTVAVRAVVRDTQSGLAIPYTLPPGTIAYLPLDEGSGTFAFDVSGNKNHGTLMSSYVNWSNSGCRLGGCVTFTPHLGSSIWIAPSATMRKDAFTFSAWVQGTGTGSDFQQILSWEKADFVDLSCSNGLLYIYTQKTGLRSTGVQLRGRGWVHVAFVHDAATLKVYADGAFAASYSDDTTADPEDLFIGSSWNQLSGNFDGRMDEVKMFGYAATAADIRRIYEKTGVADPALVALSTDGGATFQEVSSGTLTGGIGSTALQVISASSLAVRESPSSVSAGNLVKMLAQDVAGNVTTYTFGVFVDTTPPTSSLSVSGTWRDFGGRRYILGQTPMSINGVDLLSGVKENRLRVDSGDYAVTAGDFILPHGNHDLSFYSVDQAGNSGSSATVSVKVDGIAPAAAADLVAVVPSTGGMTLAWTSPGDDGSDGAILSGESRVQYGGFGTTFNPGQAQIVENIVNQASGTAKVLRIEGLAPGTDYTFALWTKDTAGNYSAAATVSARTQSLAQSVDQVASIISPEPLLTVSTITQVAAAGPLSVSTTQGLGTLTPTFYELNTGSTEPVHFSTPAVLNFVFDGNGVDLGQVAIFKYLDVGGLLLWSSASIVNQTLIALTPPLYQISGQIYSASLYSIFEKRDILPPRTTLTLGEPKYVAGESYLTLATELTLSALDDRYAVGDGMGQGVSGTQYAVDGGAAAMYISPVRLSGEGPHEFAFFSVDRKNNLEARQTRRLVLDGTPPATTISLSTPSFEAFVSPLTTVKLSAQDPPAGAVPGSGVARLLYAVGAGQLAQGPLEFGLKGPEGRYELSYQAQDNLGNLEALQKKTYSLDSTPPVSLADIGAHSYSAPDGKKYVSPLTPITLGAQDPAINETASGLKLIEVDLGQGFAAYQNPLNFAAGKRELHFRAADNVGNIEPAKTLEVYVDATMPVTSIAYDGFHILRADSPGLPPAEAEEFISPQTKVILTAQDPGTDFASGVKLTEYRLDDGAWIAYSVPFSITAEGLHTLTWRSKDQVDNEETLHSIKLGVLGDIQPPRTVMSIGAPKYVAADTYLTSATELTLTAVDDRLTVGDGLGLGVERTEYSVDAGIMARYTVPIKLADMGPHNVAFFSTDILGHAEASQSRRLVIDDSPPLTTVSLSTPTFGAYISPRTTVKLAAQDPPSGDVPGSGLAKVLYAIGGGGFSQGPLEFGLTGPDGTYELSYQAQDNLGNLEALQKKPYSLDGTAPVTAISFNGPHLLQSAGSGAVPEEAGVFITSTTQVVLSATDPTTADMASGVKATVYRVDAGAWLDYTGPFALAAAGLHTVEWRSIDQVENVEAMKLMKIAVDAAAPVAVISLGAPKFTAFGLDVLSPASLISLSALDQVAAGVAAGVQDILYRVDAGPAIVYAAAFTLPEGTHELEFWGVDRVGNAGAPQKKTLAVSALRAAAIATLSGFSASGTADITGPVLSNGPVVLSGATRVVGDVKGSSVTLQGNARVEGNIVRAPAGLNPEPLSLALLEQVAVSSNSNSLIPAQFLQNGILTISGNKTLSLKAGMYLLNGLNITGGGSLVLEGPADILLRGPMTVSGNGSVNVISGAGSTSGKASDLRLFSASGQAITLSGGAKLLALVYAPLADFQMMGGSRMGGGIFVKNAVFSGNSNVLASGESLPPELVASGGSSGKGGKTADFGAGTVPGHSSLLVAADPSFMLRDLYAFPNPAVGGAKPVIHAAVGVADRVVVKIFDVSGRQTREATLDAAPQVLDDGSGPKYAYEYTWDGHIPSGVYFYTIEAEKSGQKIRKAGKLAVVR